MPESTEDRPGVHSRELRRPGPGGQRESARGRTPRWLWLLLAVSVTIIVHASALDAGYVYDDVEAILENPDLWQWGSAGRLFFVNYWGADRNIGLYRPLVQLSYLIDGAGFGFQPALSHALNLGLHLIVIALVYAFGRRLSLENGVAATAALLVGVHPALLDASVWISGRTDVLAALFVMAGLLTALGASAAGESWRGPRTILLGVCYLLGLWSKEMAVTLPLLVLLLPGRHHARRLPVLVAALFVYVAFRACAVDGFLPQWARDGEGIRFQGVELVDRVLLGSRACLRLLALLPFSFGLAADHQAHPWAAASAVPGVSGFASAVFIFAVAACGLWLRRRGQDILGFLMSGVAIVLLPILQIVPIGAVMAERFLYLPAAFLVVLVVMLLRTVLATTILRRLVAIVAALALSIVTVHRIPVYTDRGTYCRDVIREYPGDYKAWNNLGVFHFLKLREIEAPSVDHVRAEVAFQTALEIHPAYRRGRLNLARARLDWHQANPAAASLEPIEEWLEPLVRRADPDALYLLGKAGLRRGYEAPDSDDAHIEWESAFLRYAEAASIFERSGSRKRAAVAWKEAGLTARALGDLPLLRQAWARALELDPAIAGAAAMEREVLR